MARYYDQASGQFKDTSQAGSSVSPAQNGANAYQGAIPGQPQTIPDTTSAPPPSPDEPMTSIGIPDSQLRNIFFKMGMKDPKSISSLNALYNFVKPTNQSASDKKAAAAKITDQKDQEKANKAIDSIFQHWQKGVADSPINRIKAFGAEKTSISSLSPAYAGIQAQFFANLEPKLRKAVAAGRITQSEIQWLKTNLLPNATDSQESAQEKLNALKSAFGDYTNGINDNNSTQTIDTNSLGQ